MTITSINLSDREADFVRGKLNKALGVGDKHIQWSIRFTDKKTVEVEAISCENEDRFKNFREIGDALRKFMTEMGIPDTRIDFACVTMDVGNFAHLFCPPLSVQAVIKASEQYHDEMTANRNDKQRSTRSGRSVHDLKIAMQTLGAIDAALKILERQNLVPLSDAYLVLHGERDRLCSTEDVYTEADDLIKIYSDLQREVENPEG